MKVSELKIGDIAQFKTHKLPFIVTSHYSEAITPNSTVILYDSGMTKVILWDYHNPEVEYLGKGKLEVKITKVD